MRYSKGTGIKSTTCWICHQELHDIAFLRHYALVHKKAEEEKLTKRAALQLDMEAEAELNEPRIGPDNPADWFRQ